MIHQLRSTQGMILALSLFGFSSSFANEAPTTPTNLETTVVQADRVEFRWSASSDDKRVRNYQILRNDELIATIRNTTYSDRTVLADSTYLYTVRANDGSLLSEAANLLVTTPESDTPTDSGEEQSSRPGKGNSKGGKKDQPTEEPPSEEPPAEEPPNEEPPVEEPPSNGVPNGWQMTFHDEFDGTGDLQTGGSDSNWRFESMQDGLHRAGNSGIDENGNTVADWDSARGKRWSAWYHQHHRLNAYRENGNLILGGYNSGEPDPTRPIDYMDNNVSTTYGDSKLYTAWIDTFSRVWTGPGDLHVMDPESPGKIFKYGYIEMRVNFSAMTTPGFRLSTWLMPASNDAEGQDLVVSGAYDNDGNNGVEIDLFEYEWISTEFENRIHMSVHGGAAGSSATTVDTTVRGINLHEGFHTIGFLWTAEQMIWSIDGHVVKEVSNPDLIPDVYSYLIISREMNSGVKNPDIDYIEATDMLEQKPYIPRDPGLYAKNIWEFRDRINTDQAIVDYIRIWQP